MQHVKFNKPQHGHNVNGANTSLFAPGRSIKDDRARAEAFYRNRAREQQQLREAQAIARGKG